MAFLASLLSASISALERVTPDSTCQSTDHGQISNAWARNEDERWRCDVYLGHGHGRSAGCARGGQLEQERGTVGSGVVCKVTPDEDQQILQHVCITHTSVRDELHALWLAEISMLLRAWLRVRVVVGLEEDAQRRVRVSFRLLRIFSERRF